MLGQSGGCLNILECGVWKITHFRITAKGDCLFLILLFCGLPQAVLSTSQGASLDAQGPLRIDAYSATRNQRNQPRITYPKQARQLHINGKVEIELGVSAKGGVISERVISGPPELRQAAIDAFKKVKYNPFLRDGKPSVALVRAIIAYESDNRTAFELNSEPLEVGDDSTGRLTDYVEILSDTQGVDFGRYLRRILWDLRTNWYQVAPAEMGVKKGAVSIEFFITRYGKIGGMKLMAESGSVPFDRAVWAAIMASDPLPPLPQAFGGASLTLRLRFLYDRNKAGLK
jgi:TonB family protein